MTLPLATARATIRRIRTEQQFRALFAQAHARYVLFQVGEERQHFPSFAENIDDAVTQLAYSLLAASCSLAEHGEREEATRPMEEAASLLLFIHEPETNRAAGSDFHLLVAAMAYYAASHYSRAFVTIATAETLTDAGRLIAAFLRRDFRRLIEVINLILLSERYRDSDVNPPSPEEGAEGDEHELLDAPGIVVTALLARALNHVLEYTLSGGGAHLEQAQAQIADALTIAATASHPGWWWIARLLRLMLNDLGGASPWAILPPLVPTGGEKLSRYTQALAAIPRRPVIELWLSQRAALPKALDDASKGAVISLRTSGGKTRVAEIAILKTLTSQPGSKIMYIAPFRSLAFEVERTFSETFEGLGFTVSHLYGGSQVSAVDRATAEENDIVIATPEKARAYLRAVPEMIPRFKLYVIDEGHLIGLTEREVRNELFIDHLRVLAGAHNARMLLLSAVLPNAEDIAAWIAGDGGAVATSDWRPATERLGKMHWNGERVRLEWLGATPSFNPSFVVKRKISRGRRRKAFPHDKNEAIAATALRLSAAGPVLVFTGFSVQVPGLAEAHLVGLEDSPTPHNWPKDAWTHFELVCQEHYPADAVELAGARAGIVCHHGRLPPEVRLATESLMRSTPPRIVVATTSLAQGVNIGVSTMLVANLYTGKKTRIPNATFWNLAGRAGRAFVDTEGRVLVAVDHTDDKGSWRDKLADEYFDREKIEPVRSGILQLLAGLRNMATKGGVDFERLMELCAENDFSALGKADVAEYACDLMDDGVLALHLDLGPQDKWTVDADWIDVAFRDSLAVIQAERESAGSGDSIRLFLKSRIRASVRRVPSRGVAQRLVSSSLPLSAALSIHGALTDIKKAVEAFSRSSGASRKVALETVVSYFESLTLGLPGSAIDYRPEPGDLAKVRSGWLGGVPLRELLELCDEGRLFSQFYGFELPWVMHGASCQLASAGEKDSAGVLETLGLLVETGLPEELAARLYRAGLRSRRGATELARILGGSVMPTGPRQLREFLCSEDVKNLASAHGSESLCAWVEHLRLRFARREDARHQAKAIKWPSATGIEKLSIREHGGQHFLCSLDYEVQLRLTGEVVESVRPATNDPTVVYVRQQGDRDIWNPVVRA